MLRFAVERNFEIIGEVIKRPAAADQTTAAQIGDCRQIIAFRNVLIHGYDLVDPRGDVVHRSDKNTNGRPKRHMVSKEDLDKAIRFLKLLVAATDGALNK